MIRAAREPLSESVTPVNRAHLGSGPPYVHMSITCSE